MSTEEGALSEFIGGEHDRRISDFALDTTDFPRIGVRSFGQRLANAVGKLAPRLAKECGLTEKFKDRQDKNGNLQLCLRTIGAMGCDLKKDMCNYLHVGKQLPLFTKAKVSKHPLIVAFLIARCGGPWYDSNVSNFERLGITSRDKRKQWMREQTAAQLERHNEAEGLAKAPKPSAAELDAEREFAEGTPWGRLWHTWRFNAQDICRQSFWHQSS